MRELSAVLLLHMFMKKNFNQRANVTKRKVQISMVLRIKTSIFFSFSISALKVIALGGYINVLQVHNDILPTLGTLKNPSWRTFGCNKFEQIENVFWNYLSSSSEFDFRSVEFHCQNIGLLTIIRKSFMSFIRGICVPQFLGFLIYTR